MSDPVETQQYRVRMPVPDFASLYPRDVRGARDNFYDIIEAVGWHTPPGSRDLVTRPVKGEIFVWLEAGDLYELAGKVRDLEDELNSSLAMEHIMLDRPQRVERKARL